MENNTYNLLLVIGDLEVQRRKLLSENMGLKNKVNELLNKNKIDERKYDDIANKKLAENN